MDLEGDAPKATKPPYVYVDPHVLATPILHDFNEDGKPELIIPVTYYFDPYHFFFFLLNKNKPFFFPPHSDKYSDPVKKDALGGIDISKYVACSILIIDLFDTSIIAHHRKTNCK